MTSTPSKIDVTIRALRTPDEMNQAVEIQHIYWGEDMGAMVSQHMLLSIAHYGGQILGAFDGDRIVGLLIGFIGAQIDPDDSQPASSRLLVMSKRMVVLPEYRSHKIGENLKLAQRDYALRHKIPLITWTFDPMLSRNAYLNLHKLRGVIQKYIPDFFGQNALNPTLRADRVSLNWWVNHPRIKLQPLPDNHHAPILNPCKLRPDGLLIPADSLSEQLSAPVYRLQIPAEFTAYETADASLTQYWRDHIRQAFMMLLQADYIATDFVRMDNASYYIFAANDGTYAFSSDTTPNI